MKELIGDEKQHQEEEKKICEYIGGRERGKCHTEGIHPRGAEMLG